MWWLALYHSCAINGEKACNAFYPDGNYFDIRGPPFYCTDEFLSAGTKKRGHVTRFRKNFPYDHCTVRSEDGNPGAVLFLREVAVTAFLMLVISAEFKYPLLNIFGSGGPAARGRAPQGKSKESENPPSGIYWVLNKVNSVMKWIWVNVVKKNEFEIFMYTHVVTTYTVAIALFFSRMEVFYGAAFCWGLYFLDRLYVIIFRTHKFKFSRECSEEYKGAMKLTLKKRNGREWDSVPGQIVYIQCPHLGGMWLGRQWHAFSLAASSTYNSEEEQDRIELLIQVNTSRNAYLCDCC